MYNIDNFTAIVREMITLFGDMTAVENEKIAATSENDIAKVESCMNKEQAYMLKLRGLDKKREVVQRELSYEDLTFRQIIEQEPPEQAQELNRLYDQLNDSVAIFRNSSENAKKIIEVTLHYINTAMTNLESQGVGKQANTYNNQSEIKKNHNFKSIKI